MAIRHLAELLVDRVWRSRSQLELSVVEYVSWFNHERLHESLGDRSPWSSSPCTLDRGSGSPS
jgi:transposase InsO family protein